MAGTTFPIFRDILKVAIRPSWESFGVWFSSLILLAGIFLWNWDAKIIVLAYVLETIVIGVIHIFKMIAASFTAKDPGWEEKNRYAGVFLVVFFCFHYFIFVAIQTSFVLNFFNYNFSFSQNSIFESLTILFSLPEMKVAFSAIIFNNVYDAVRNYFLPRKYQNVDLAWLMFQPYVRVFIQQFMVIFGGGALLITQAASVLASLLILARTFVDLVGVAITTNVGLRGQVLGAIARRKDNPQKEQQLREILNDMME